MTSGQKAIKCLATVFAIGLIVSIIGGILSFIGFVTYKDDGIKELEKVYTSNKEIKSLTLDIAASELLIEKGSELTVTTNNKYIKCEEKKDGLVIEETKHNYFFNFNKNSKVILTIPENYTFDRVKLETGAGLIDIETLNASIVDLDLGAGKVEIDYLKVTEKAEIDGGAGKMTINNAEIKNLDFDMGVGESNINGSLIGRSNIDCGVGRLNLNIYGSEEDYTLKFSKGIGEIKVNDMHIENNTTLGSGINYLDIDGGVGAIEVNFS